MDKLRETEVIVIEGQIGVGKTTLGNLLSKEIGYSLYRELENPITLSMLDQFYLDQERWGFTMQIHFLNERFRMIKEIHKNGGGLLDRSLFGDHVFADILHKQGKMTEGEYKTYSTLLFNMLEHCKPPHLMIYLDCSVDTAIERITKRNRGIESTIPRDYLETLNSHYLEWFESYNYSPKIKIDYNQYDIFTDEGKHKLLTLLKPYLKNYPEKWYN